MSSLLPVRMAAGGGSTSSPLPPEEEDLSKAAEDDALDERKSNESLIRWNADEVQVEESVFRGEFGD